MLMIMGAFFNRERIKDKDHIMRFSILAEVDEGFGLIRKLARPKRELVPKEVVDRHCIIPLMKVLQKPRLVRIQFKKLHPTLSKVLERSTLIAMKLLSPVFL